MKNLVVRLGTTAAVGLALVAGVALAPRQVDASDRSLGSPAASAAATRVPLVAQELVCPGGPHVEDGKGQVLGAPLPRALADKVPGGVTTGAGAIGIGPLEAEVPDRRDVTAPVATDELGASRSWVVSATGSRAPGLSGAQVLLAPEGDHRALAVAACGAPSRDTWLVGGGPQPGRVEQVVLSNPATSPVTARLTVLGEKPRPEPLEREVVVPARGRAVVVLDSLAPQEKYPVVRVRALQGAVHAALLDAWLDGVVPRGEDAVQGTEPAQDLVLPGVIGAGGRSVVRVAVPGTEEAVVELRAWTTSGQKGLAHAVTRVPGGAAVDIDVSDLSGPVGALSVHADVPVVAGATSTATSAEADLGRDPSDLAWTSATPPVTKLAGAPLVGTAGPRRTAVTQELVLSAPAAATVTVAQVAADGDLTTREVQVPAAGSVVVPVKGSAAWVLPGGTPVAAALVVRAASGGPLLSVLPLREAATTAERIPVRAR